MDTDKESIEPHHLKSNVDEKVNICICPQCGYETSKKMGVPCRTMKCPVCDIGLINK